MNPAARRALRTLLGASDVDATVSEGDLTRHAETIREALKLALDTAPSAAAALRFAEALAAMEGKG